MTHTEPRPVASLSLLALTITAVAIAFAPSTPASGATHAARAKHHCISPAFRKRSVHASHRHSARASHRHSAHRLGVRKAHRKAVGCTRARPRRRGELRSARRGGSKTIAPTAPTNLTVAPGDARVALSWGVSTDRLGVAGYRVYRDGGQVMGTSGTSFTDVALTNGVTYSYYVVAYDTAGYVSSPSETVLGTPRAATVGGPFGGPQTNWGPVGVLPRSDAEAAALVIHVPESVPANEAANNYVPSDAELVAFHAGQGTRAHQYPYSLYVTGRSGLITPSTDDLIQWAAAKWQIPSDWIRAVAVQESHGWQQNQSGGDARTYGEESAATGLPAGMTEQEWYDAYLCSTCKLAPPDGKGGAKVLQSLGITSIKWRPGNKWSGAGTEPLRWKSTAFNLDYYGASIRSYFDGLATWVGGSYRGGEEWESIGAWFEPTPWENSGQQEYIKKIQTHLERRDWP
jgi:hypothetical protein